ncbi:MAG: hypothetical protein NZL90_04915 [Aquificaceae bacterium]|nr:hypothetical protein [Aquificaceae bacterium]MDW8237048.1 hypothetical protein [Aquificaceae bacterium]
MDRLDYFLSLLEKSPDNPMLHYSLAKEYERMGNCQKVIEHIRRYLELKEDEGAIYRSLARCLEEIGDIEGAKNALKEGIEKALKYNHPSMAEEFRAWLLEFG